ncbi:unnamed protein product [Rhizophagus irregularis]|nr:unnamed protein product [Rhizophagus irregularis]
MLEEEANKNEEYKTDELDIFIETNKITHLMSLNITSLVQRLGLFRTVPSKDMSQFHTNTDLMELKLPSRKVLAGCILNTNSEHIKKSLIDTTQKDELGVTVCFDGWKNVNNDLDKQNIKYNAVITNSASLNQAARYVKLLIAALKVLISKYASEEFDQEDEAIYHFNDET